MKAKDLHAIRDKAYKIGAPKCLILDLQETFAKDYLVPALQANALYENVYPLVSALSRPLIAKTLTELAKDEGAEAVAHGCTGKGNDQVRFDLSIKALAPHLKYCPRQRKPPLPRRSDYLCQYPWYSLTH